MIKKVLERAAAWLGTPYHPGARVIGAGVDCCQILIDVYSYAGYIEAFTPPPYSNEWHLHQGAELYLEAVAARCDKVAGGIDAARPGDIFMYKYGRTVSHGAIYIGGGEIIHAYAGRGVIRTRYDDNILYDRRGRLRLAAIFRPKGDE